MSLGFFLMAAHVQTLNEDVDGQSYSVVDTESSPTPTAVASVSVNSDGSLTFVGNAAPADTDWLISGSPGDYEVFATASSGSPSGPTLGVWHATTSNRTWTVTRSTAGTTTAIMEITIRQTALTSNSITFAVDPLQANYS